MRTAPVDVEAQPADRTRAGSAFMMFAVLSFSTSSVLVRVSTGAYSIYEIAFFRQLIALAAACVLILLNGGFQLVRTRRLRDHFVRALFGNLSMYCTFGALALLPLAEVASLSYTMPLFSAALSVPLLGERMHWVRWLSIVVGFAGTLVVIHPTDQALGAGGALAVLASLFYALAVITTKPLAAAEGHFSVLFYNVSFGVVFAVFLLPLGWKPPQSVDMLAFTVIGVAGACGQYFITRAAALTPVSVFTILGYTSLLWATAFGYAFLGEVPQATTLIGAVIILASCAVMVFWK